MYYKLNKQYILRGWIKLPFAVINTENNRVVFVNQETMEVLKLCDASFDFNMPVFIDGYKNILKYLLEIGWISECNKQDEILPSQKYKLFDSRYIIMAHWSITGRCNYRCKHCYMSAPDAKYGELPYEEIKSIAKQLRDCGVLNVSLTGGEPLVRKDFMDLVDLLLDYGIKIVRIYSNGLLVNEKLLKGLRDRNIFPEFNMSFDGTENWHDWLRGVDGATENIKRAFELCREYGFPTGAEMCVHDKNKHTLRDSVNFLANLGCANLKTSPVSDVGAWKEGNFGKAISLKDLFETYLDYIPYYFEDGMPMFIQLGGFFAASPTYMTYSIPSMKPDCDLSTTCICGHARQTMYISPEGRCLPCMSLSGMDIQTKFPLISEKGLKYSITDSYYMNLIETTADTVIKHNEKCKNCEFASRCLGGCRASALEFTQDDILGADEATCMIFKDGYIDRINNIVKKYKPELKFKC